MEFLRKIRDFIQDLEEKDFYKYLGITIAIVILLVSFMIYRYYKKTNEYIDMIEETNVAREEEVRQVLKRDLRLKKQKEKVNDILKEEKDFKILDYYNKLLTKLNLSEEYKKSTDSVVAKDASGGYKETELSARLENMDMQQLCELLQELEQEERIMIRALEIKRSKKKGKKAIDVDLTISTLLLPEAEEAT